MTLTASEQALLGYAEALRAEEADAAARQRQRDQVREAELLLAGTLARKHGQVVVDPAAAPAPAADAPAANGTAAPVAAPAPLRGTLAPPAPAATPAPAHTSTTAPTAAVSTVTGGLIEGMHIPVGTPIHGESGEGVKPKWQAYGPITHDGQEWIVVCYIECDATVGVLRSEWDINRQPALKRARELADAEPGRRGVVGTTRRILFGG